MTVSDRPSAWAYTGDGTTDTFAYENLVLADGEVQVYLDGVLTPSGYTVTGVGNSAGGSVVFATAPAAGVDVVVRTNVRPTQPTDYVDGDDFPAEAHETGMDRLARVVQQGLDALTRAPRLKLGDAALEMPEIGVTLAELKGKVWFSNASTGAVEGRTLADLPVDVMISTDTPAAPTTAGAAGSSTDEVSPADHAHPLPAVSGLATRDDDAIGVPAASQAEAEAGANNTKAMTALRVAQAIAALATGANLSNVQIFTSSGTYNRTAGVTKALAIAVGGGGGGGGVGTTSGTGRGGSGGAGETRMAVVSPGSSETVTIGGGASGGASGANAGSNGGDTSFGSHVEAGGGEGGGASAGNDSGSSGSPTTGSGGIVIPPSAAASSNSLETRGGSTWFGQGALMAATNSLNTGSAGRSASGPGGGGTGGLDGGTTARQGGNGDNGLVIVIEFGS